MENEPELRRLGWAGIELKCEGHRLVIDLFENRTAMAPFIKEVSGPLLPPGGPVDLALVTHLHADHADVPAIGRVLKPGGPVLRPGPAPGDDLDRAMTAVAEAQFAELDGDVRTVGNWETVEHGPFTVTAVPAVDGFGDPQVSWVVEAGGRRIFHGGDTTFHGGLWPIASRFKPFDTVFLPVNGPMCSFPHRQPPSPYPAALDPVGAAAAAEILGAELAVPIHFDEIHVEGLYEQADDPGPAFEEEAAARGVATRFLDPEQEQVLEWAA
ncbi:MAG: MBL fold metallo-hydrolase [Solirubrobacterales bacterium]